MLIAAAGLSSRGRPSIAHASDGRGARPTRARPPAPGWRSPRSRPASSSRSRPTSRTDIAAAPFLWVVPLALYLLTFVAVFRERPWIAHATVAPAGADPGGAARDRHCSAATSVFWLAMIVRQSRRLFVLLALLCHGELYRRRPAPARLTEFYLWVSVGGVHRRHLRRRWSRPMCSTEYYEYPILIAGGAAGAAGHVRRRRAPLSGEAGPVLAVAGARHRRRSSRSTSICPPRPNCRSNRAGRAGRPHAVAAPPPGALLRRWWCSRSSSPALWQPGFNRDRDRRAASSASTRWSRPPTARHRLLLSRHHHARRRAHRDAGGDAGRPARAADLLLFRRADLGGDRGGARRAGGLGASRPSVSAPAASPATAATARAGRSSRSIRTWCGSPATRAISASCRRARRLPIVLGDARLTLPRRRRATT